MEERNKRNESLRKRSSRRRRKTSIAGNIDKASSLFDNKLVLIIVVVVVLIALVFGLSLCGKENTGDSENTGDIAVETTTEPSGEVDPSTYELQKDAIPQVNDLVNTYFTVMKNADAEGYMNIVAGDEMTQDKLTKKGEFIEDYLNVSCYTKPGMSEGEYVAFVYFDVKFRNIDTPAPSLSRLYICSNEDGTMYIYAGPIDDELSSYINVVSNDDEIRDLVSKTNKALEDACNSDDKLAALYELLILGVQPSEEETTPEQETGVDELTFETRDEKVITTTAVRVRSTPTTDTDDNILGKVEAGEEFKRVGYSDTWSKIIYNGKEAYVSSEYVITN